MSSTKNVHKILKEILSRKDPFGYYVVVAINSVETKNSILKYKNTQLLVEELGDTIILRCRSRRIVEEVVRKLVSKKLLAEI